MRTGIFALILLNLSLTGCVVTVDSDYASSAHWDRNDIQQIEVGETKKEWVLAAIGIPDSERTKSDGTEVWRYKNISERETKVGVFLLLHFDLEREHHQNLQIEFRDDVVSDYWLESKWIE